MAMIGASTGTAWIATNQHAVYLSLPHTAVDFGLWIKMVGTWILMFTNLVPISLIVCLEVLKFWQGFFMMWDVDMYDPE